jgi:nicotinamidase-related amidase
MSRALLVIDVQREYFEGAFPIRHPVGHLEVRKVNRSPTLNCFGIPSICRS